MKGGSLSPFPHLSWFVYGLDVHRPRVFVLHEFRAVTHQLMVTAEGDAEFLWTTRAGRMACHMGEGSLSFLPCDAAVHSLGITATGAYRGHAILVPSGHLKVVCEEEGASPTGNCRARTVFRDTLLSACALRLVSGKADGRLAQDVGSEIAARQVIMRLAVLTGGEPPDWLRDTSVFAPHMMAMIVERVDTHLSVRPSLDEISRGFGLSPSHFARKFQQSTGESLNRFMNRRRIALSFELLKAGKASLSQIALDLGFSSQSHFTRLFSGLTGITPLQFRRAQRLSGQ